MRRPPQIFGVLLAIGIAARLVSLSTAAAQGGLVWTWSWLLAPLAIVGAALADAAVCSIPPWALARLRAQRLARITAALGAAYLSIQPVFYALFQSPLTANQLILASDPTNLTSSILAATPWWSWTFTLCATLAAAAAAPDPQEAPAQPTSAIPSGSRASPALVVAAACALIAWTALPAHSTHGISRSVLGALVPSATPAPAPLTLRPSFDRTPSEPTLPYEPLGALTHPTNFPRRGANVVLWALESTSVRRMEFGEAGFERIMPELASLAADGVSFDRYYAITPVSMKSLVSMTCSIHPYTRPQALTYINPDIACADLATELTTAGYRAALFHAGHFHYSDKDRFFRPRGYEVLLDADPIRRRYGGAKNAWGVEDSAMVDAAIDWLGGVAADERFFLLMIPVTPHHPYGGDYIAALGAVDREIGRLRRAVEAKWPAGRTLHVIAGDHGEAFDEHPGHTMHGSYIYEEAMRVPLILSNPEIFHGGARSVRIGNHVDLAPTILDALDLPRSDRHEGTSLLRGHAPHMVHFYTEYAHHQLGLRDGRYKYILDLDVGSEQVFDLLVDPGERVDLSGATADRLPRWRRSVREFEAFYQALIPHYDSYWFPARACAQAARCDLAQFPPAFAHGRWRKNRSARGKPLTASGRVWTSGIGVAAPSILRWSVRGMPFRHLRGSVAHDDDIYAGQLAAVVSGEIYVDGRLRFHSGKLRRGDPPRTFDVDVQGAETVELFAHDLDGLQYRNLVDWLDVRLER